MSMDPVKNKHLNEVAHEWDSIVALRMQQIQDGVDISFEHVLRPCIMNLAMGCDFSNVIDVGCGGGFLSEDLAKISSRVVGVDISGESVCLARQRLQGIENITFVHTSVEDFSEIEPSGSFTLAIANMTLMTVPSLETTVKAISSLLTRGGYFVFTITHPCFWPSYWGYSDASWFNYSREIAVEAPFRISQTEAPGPKTTHIHRSLENYLNVLIGSGFEIGRLAEPLPSPEIEKRYLTRWKYPRFIGIRCIRKP
jgi:2-polyprenyl-3-methyl-5-hydroxy-6-metoxy-1,4-benzoquinol methylase